MIDTIRVRNILLEPGTEWPKIASEAASVKGIVQTYLIWLLGLAAVVSFLSMAVIGVGGFFATVRFGLFASLAQAFIGAMASLLTIYLMSLLVNALAPSFGGSKNSTNAFKLVAYASTAALLGSVLSIVPWIGWLLAFAAGLYSIFLMYKGLPILMQSPQEKSMLFTLVLIVAGIVLSVLIGAVSAMFSPAMDSSALSISSKNGNAELNSGILAQLEDRVDALNKNMKSAEASGDLTQVATAAATGLNSLLGGDSARKPLTVEAIKEYVPADLGGFKRESFSAESQTVMGIEVTKATARYREGEKSLTLEVLDSGATASLLSIARWAISESDRETDQLTERSFQRGDRTYRQVEHKDGSSATHDVMLKNGVMVTAQATKMTLAEAQAVVDAIGLDLLEAL